MSPRRTGPQSDDLLLGRYLAGDARAFELLMEAHERRVFAICLRILRDREEALDATQETFITVLRKAGGFEGRAAFSTWLYRVAVNTCYDQLRKKRRRSAGRLPEGYDPRTRLSTASSKQSSFALPSRKLSPGCPRSSGRP